MIYWKNWKLACGLRNESYTSDSQNDIFEKVCTSDPNFVFLVTFYVFSQNQLVNINDDIDVKNVYLVDNMSSTYYEGIKNSYISFWDQKINKSQGQDLYGEVVIKFLAGLGGTPSIKH